MNTTNLFLDPAQTVHFLSLFTYLSKLSDIFYSEELLRAEDKHEPFPIVNAYYEHLKGKNETEAKQRIVQKLLEGSELYGGQRNETLDMGYVNNTLDYIITNAVFSQSGNLYGYLAEIASLSSSLKLSVFKTKVLDHLSQLRQLKDDGGVSNLTRLATGKIAETILWPLFPNPPNDMEIISLKYIYALGGYNLAKSAQMNLMDISFSRFVTLGMTIEASAMGDELPISVLQFFALPAMIHYANNQTEKFDQQTTQNLIGDPNFWSEAFLTLFTYLNSTLELIRQEEIENNSLYQFHVAMSTFKNRTFIARNIIQRECKYLNESYVESLIDDYKTYSASANCYKGGKKLPNLESIYDAQFHEIKDKYRLMEIDFIRAAFDEFPAVRNLINSSDTKVFRSLPIPKAMRCNMCAPNIPSYNPNINFFAIKRQGKKEFYAFEQNENNVTLLIQKDNNEFNKRVGLPEGRNLEVSGFIKIYKEVDEDFEKFVQRFAEIKAEEFRNKLFEYGYDRTSMEKFFEIVKSFIPFYDCVKFSKAGEQGLATFSCFGDVATFLPLAKFLNLGFKMTTAVAGRFLIASGLTLKTFTLRQAIRITMTTGLRGAALGFKEMLTKVFLTKQMLKNLSIGVIRCLDPGFELVGKLAWHGNLLIGKVLNKAFKYISKKFPALNFKYAKFETMWLHLTRNGLKPPDDFQTLPKIQIEGHEVLQSIYPGGENPFGPKYVRLSKNYAELRKMVGFENQIPVIVTRVTKRGRIIYRRINLKTEEPFGLELKLNREGYLENARQPFQRHIYLIKTEGLGGRRALSWSKEISMEKAANLVTNANIGVTKQEVKGIISHYILANNDPDGAEDVIDSSVELMNLGNLDNVLSSGSVTSPFNFLNPDSVHNLNNDMSTAISTSDNFINSGSSVNYDIMNFDNMNPDSFINSANTMNSDNLANLDNFVNTANFVNADNLVNANNVANVNTNINPDVNDFLREYNMDPIIDVSLNDYLESPTYKIFALDWARTGRINPLYQKYYVENFEEMNKLLYDLSVESQPHYNAQIAYVKITALYGEHYVNQMPVTVETVFGNYVLNMVWRHLTFEDYYALYIWKDQGFKSISGNPTSAMLLRKSLHRLAIRQTTKKSFPKTLYHMVIRKRTPQEGKLSSLVGKTIKSNDFVICTSNNKFISNEIHDIYEKMVKNTDKQIFVHKIRVNSAHLTIDINNIMPENTASFVIIPGISFTLKKVEQKRINGYNVIIIDLMNEPISKEIMIARSMNEIND